MGQRLNIEVHHDGKVLANAYYHWSTYTENALDILGQVLSAYKNSREINPLRVAVEILQATGAGVNKCEKDRIAKEKSGKFNGIEFHDAIDRNEGLLSVSEKGIKETRDWEEGSIIVDISTEEFLFNVMYSMDVKEYDTELGSTENLQYTEFNFHEPFSFYDYDEMAKVIQDNPGGVRDGENTVLHWVT